MPILDSRPRSTEVQGIGSLPGTSRTRSRAQTKAPPEDQLHAAIARHHMYWILSLGFRYPSAETAAALKEEFAGLSSLTKSGFKIPCFESLQGLEASLNRLSVGQLEADYLRVFTHVVTPDCNPCETAYTAVHMFQQSQKIADLNGFYRAFGVEPGIERSDHVCIETEFMAFLAQKEARALTQNRPRRASMARRTQKAFLEDHLGPWIRALARFVEHKAETGFYAALATLTINFFEWEFEHCGVAVRELKGPLKPLPLMMAKEEEDDDEDCPAFATAEPDRPAPGGPLQI